MHHLDFLDICAILLGILFTVAKLDTQGRNASDFPHVKPEDFERWRSWTTSIYRLGSGVCFLRVIFHQGWALLLGVVAGAVCALAVELKWKLGFDDSLDVVGVHLVGGLIGTLYLGFFATSTGLFVGGNAEQLILQAIAAFGVLIYSFVVAWIIGFAIEKTFGFRIKNEDEIAGVDTVVHGEEGYAIQEA